MNRIFIRALLLFTLLVFPATASAAITLSVLPDAGKSAWVHTINGLAVGEKVTVERIADFNGNGVIDPGEQVVRSFVVQDGVRPIIGGVVNGNVPGDDDATANGSIRVDLPVGGVDLILNTLPGKYVIRASGPSGMATFPLEFSVAATPQKISGVVRDSSNNSPVPFAIIVVLIGDGFPSGSVRADANGAYTVNAPAGQYALIPFADNLVGSFNQVSLAANVNTTLDLSMTPATLTVSGKISDASTQAGLNSIFVIAEGDSGLAGSLTDLSGNYSLKVTAGNWRVHPLEDFVAQLGYVFPKDAEQLLALTNSGTAANFQLTRANALLYGKVTDAASAPMSGLHMRAQTMNFNSSGQLEADGRTSPTGDYWLGVLGGTDWDFSPHDFVGDFVVLNYNASPNVGQAIEQNMTVQTATGHIMGTVKNSNGQPLVDLGVHAEATINNFVYDLDARTDDTGFYSLPAINGTWNVSLDCSSLASMNYSCPGNKTAIVNNNSPTADFTIQIFNVTAHLNGTVVNQSGQPVGGIQLAASNNSGVIRNATSDSTTGSFSIGISGGSWILQVAGNPPAGFVGPTMNFNVTDGTDVNNIVFKLHAADATISGSLKNSFGEAIPGIHIHFNTTINGVLYDVQNGVTGVDGTFTASVPKASITTYPDCGDLNRLGFICVDPISLNTTSGSARLDAVIPRFGPSLQSPRIVSGGLIEVFVSPISAYTTYDVQGSPTVPFNPATSTIIQTFNNVTTGATVQFNPGTNRFFRVIAR